MRCFMRRMARRAWDSWMEPVVSIVAIILAFAIGGLVVVKISNMVWLVFQFVVGGHAPFVILGLFGLAVIFSVVFIIMSAIRGIVNAAKDCSGHKRSRGLGC